MAAFAPQHPLCDFMWPLGGEAAPIPSRFHCVIIAQTVHCGILHTGIHGAPESDSFLLMKQQILVLSTVWVKKPYMIIMCNLKLQINTVGGVQILVGWQMDFGPLAG